MHTKIKILAAALLLALCLLPAVRAQSAFSGYSDGVTGLPLGPIINITNALAGVGGLHSTNTLTQITNGTTSITSAPVALRGNGFAFWAVFSPTNALLTNLVGTLRFSCDGTNWSNEPIITFRTATAAIAGGKYVFGTNYTRDVVGNFKFVQLQTIYVTNGVNTVGSIFCTNNGPTFAIQTFL